MRQSMQQTKEHLFKQTHSITWWLQCVAAICVMLGFLWYHGYYYMHEHQQHAAGKVDLAVFYIAGAAITNQAELEPLELYTQNKIRPAIELIRKQDGGSHYLYLPQAAILFAPATLVPFSVFAKLWAVIDALLLIGSFYAVLYWLIGDKAIFHWHYTLLLALLGFAKTTESLTATGQLNGLILALCVFMLVSIQHHKNILGGISIGVAATLKIFPLVWLPYLALKKHWRTCISGLVTCLILWMMSIPFFGIGGLGYFMKEKLPEISSGEITGVYKSSSIYGSLRNAVRNDILTLDNIPKEQLISYINTLTLVLAILTIAWAGWIIFKHRNSHSKLTYLLDYGLMMCCLLLFAKIVHQQYHLWIIPLLIYLWHWPVQKKYVWLHSLGLLIFMLTQFGKDLPIPGIDVWLLKPQTIGILLLFGTIILLRTNWFTKHYGTT